MAKFNCNIEKYSSTGGIDSHNNRKFKNHSNKDIDVEKSNLNYSLVECENITNAINEKISEVQKLTTKKIRKDAVKVCEAVLSLPDSVPAEREKEYFSVCLNYFEDQYGKENIVAAIVHKDETTPHMHVDFVPITKDNRLCAKDLINRNSLRKMQSDLPKLLQEKGFDIERGEEGSKAKHLTVKEFKKQKDQELKIIENKIDSYNSSEHVYSVSKIKRIMEDHYKDDLLQLKPGTRGKFVLKSSIYDNEIVPKLNALEVSAESAKKFEEINKIIKKENAELKEKNSIMRTRIKDLSQENQDLKTENKKLKVDSAILKKIIENFPQLKEKAKEYYTEITGKIKVQATKVINKIKTNDFER